MPPAVWLPRWMACVVRGADGHAKGCFVRLSFRYALVAAVLLVLTEALTLVLAAPTAAVSLPPVLSYQAPDWQAGSIETQSAKRDAVRLIQYYTSTTTGDRASVETRCWSGPKDFLKWTGRLAYEGVGYEQLARTVHGLPSPRGAVVSDTLMRNSGDGGHVVILYAYLDHWGIHGETGALWPRAIVDLITRHSGPFCALAVAVPVTGPQARADGEARNLTQAFLALIDRAVAR